MFAIKIHNNKKNRGEVFNKTIKNLISYIKKELVSDNTKILSDNSCIEIISGSNVVPQEGKIVAELLIRKTVVINSEDLNDRAELDKYLSSIKHFCEQAKNIEENEYLPINMRKRD